MYCKLPCLHLILRYVFKFACFCYSISDFAIVKWSFAEKRCSSYFIRNIYLKIQNDSIKRNSILYRFNQHFLISAYICPSYDQKLNNIFSFSYTFFSMHIKYFVLLRTSYCFELRISLNFVEIILNGWHNLIFRHFDDKNQHQNGRLTKWRKKHSHWH